MHASFFPESSRNNYAGGMTDSRGRTICDSHKQKQIKESNCPWAKL